MRHCLYLYLAHCQNMSTTETNILCVLCVVFLGGNIFDFLIYDIFYFVCYCIE